MVNPLARQERRTSRPFSPQPHRSCRHPWPVSVCHVPPKTVSTHSPRLWYAVIFDSIRSSPLTSWSVVLHASPTSTCLPHIGLPCGRSVSLMRIRSAHHLSRRLLFRSGLIPLRRRPCDRGVPMPQCCWPHPVPKSPSTPVVLEKRPRQVDQAFSIGHRFFA